MMIKQGVSQAQMDKAWKCCAFSFQKLKPDEFLVSFSYMGENIVSNHFVKDEMLKTMKGIDFGVKFK
jgi:hypothetical protein